MKLRNKKTGEIGNTIPRGCEDERIWVWIDNVSKPEYRYNSLADLNEEWEDATADPLIKDEKIRKAIRAWAEANGFSIFRIYNQHFNTVKIRGAKDRYDPNGTSIEFIGTFSGVEKISYEIDQLCGDEEE